jgi:hypothetical protein
MSIETDFRTWLTGAAGVVALVPAASIAQNEVGEGVAPPYIAFDVTRTPEYGLSNVVHATAVSVRVGCWATAPAAADAIADAVTTALALQGVVITQRASAFSAETGLDGTALTAEWWET